MQIFATDVDEDALDVARQGVYPESIAADVSPERLRRFFTRSERRFVPGLQATSRDRDLRPAEPDRRRTVLQARFDRLPEHADLPATGGPAKIGSLLQFALNEGGYLFLGPSETLGQQLDLFEPISKKWRIFRRIGPSRPERVEIPLGASLLGPARRSRLPRPTRPVSFADITQRFLLAQYVPAAVLLNRKYEILYCYGPTDRYLAVSAGEPTQDITLLARDGLRDKLRTAIHKALRNSGPITLADVQVKRNGGAYPVRVTISPLQGPPGADGLLLITFQDSDQERVPPRPAETAAEQSLVRQLEVELKATQQDLQSTSEEMESANEELRAANEEVMSLNEELQSTNEELQTSNEEMQSLNEELGTVNNQLEDKVADLESANDDMANLFLCTEVAIVFLDNQLRIKRYTPPAARVFRLTATDLGQPIGDITRKFTDDTLQQDIENVLRSLTPLEKQVQTTDGRSWHERISPYRTSDNRTEGVVLTFADVTQLRQGDAQARRLATVLLDSNDAVIVHDFEGRITAWNHGGERMFGYSEAEALQMNVEVMIPQELRRESRGKWERIRRGESVDSWEAPRLTKDGRVLDVWITATALKDETGRPVAIANTRRDITEQKKAERARESMEFAQSTLDGLSANIAILDGAGTILAVNRPWKSFAAANGAAAGTVSEGANYLHACDQSSGQCGEDGPVVAAGIRAVIARQRGEFSHEYPCHSPDEERWFIVRVTPFPGEGPARVVVAHEDVSRRKELEREVIEIALLEQRRIGQDLHDECGQQLTALGLLANSLADSIANAAPAAGNLATKIEQGIQDVLRRVRSISRGLALAEVNPAGLPWALTELASRLSETSNVRCSFDGQQDVDVEDNLRATHLFHIAQEACTNALRHGNAKNIEIRLHPTKPGLVLQIQDDGTGILPNAPEGLGMRIMAQSGQPHRSAADCRNREPKGTVVTCTLEERTLGQ